MKLLGHTQQEIVSCADTPPAVAKWVASDDPEVYEDGLTPNWLVETPEDVEEHGLLAWGGDKSEAIPADKRKYEFAVTLHTDQNFINMTVPDGVSFFIPRAVMDAVPALWTEFRKLSCVILASDDEEKWQAPWPT